MAGDKVIVSSRPSSVRLASTHARPQHKLWRHFHNPRQIYSPCIASRVQGVLEELASAYGVSGLVARDAARPEVQQSQSAGDVPCPAVTLADGCASVEQTPQEAGEEGEQAHERKMAAQDRDVTEQRRAVPAESGSFR
jgi:hypothetical protein